MATTLRKPRCQLVHDGVRCQRPYDPNYQLPHGGLVCTVDAKARGLSRNPVPEVRR